MKSKVLLAVAFLAIISTIGISQEDKSKIEADKPVSQTEIDRIKKLSSDVASLYGVKGIRVLVEVLDENDEAAGLTGEQLKTDVELQLLYSGIKVNAFDEWSASEDGVYLSVNISSVSTGEFISFCVTLTSHQLVNLARKPNLDIITATWQRGKIAFNGKSLYKEKARDMVKDLTDEFINDYLTANPKK